MIDVNELTRVLMKTLKKKLRKLVDQVEKNEGLSFELDENEGLFTKDVTLF